MYAAIIEPGQTIDHELKANRYGWLQVARGSVKLNGHELNQGDGAAISRESELRIAADDQAEVLLFDLLRVDSVPAAVIIDCASGN